MVLEEKPKRNANLAQTKTESIPADGEIKKVKRSVTVNPYRTELFKRIIEGLNIRKQKIV